MSRNAVQDWNHLDGTRCVIWMKVVFPEERQESTQCTLLQHGVPLRKGMTGKGTPMSVIRLSCSCAVSDMRDS